MSAQPAEVVKDPKPLTPEQVQRIAALLRPHRDVLFGQTSSSDGAA